jgi:hypothetical protein
MKNIKFNTTATAVAIVTVFGTTMSISAHGTNLKDVENINYNKALIYAKLDDMTHKNLLHRNMNLSDVSVDSGGNNIEKNDIEMFSFFNSSLSEQKEIDEDFRKVLNQAVFNYMTSAPKKNRFN